MKKNLSKKANEKDFLQLKKEYENDKIEFENSWRVALGDFSLSFRKEKEKEKLYFLEFLAENYFSRFDLSSRSGVGGNILLGGRGSEQGDIFMNEMRMEIQVRNN